MATYNNLASSAVPRARRRARTVSMAKAALFAVELLRLGAKAAMGRARTLTARPTSGSNKASFASLGLLLSVSASTTTGNSSPLA